MPTQASIPCDLMSMLHNDYNQTHLTYTREARTCTSFKSARAIFITRRCNNRAMTAVLGRLPLFLHLGQTFPSFNEYSSFLIVFCTLQDTRTHVVVELYDTERSYVEALQILVNVSIFIILLIELNLMRDRFFVKCSSLVNKKIKILKKYVLFN